MAIYISMAFGEMQWERFDKNRRCFGIVYGRFHDCLKKKDSGGPTR
jgi:hypothetical protein